MKRGIRLHLKDVPVVPAGLRSLPTLNVATDEVQVDLGRLYHHYYFDGYGVAPPDPDPTCFEYVQLLSGQCNDFRFSHLAAKANTTRKRAISTEMGQAFCRWLLHDHFSMIYFAHINRVLKKPTHPAFDGMRIRRVAPGDTPDYLCARKVDRPSIAEAKGRFGAIAFDNAEFDTWRQQIGRIRVTDKHATALRLKTFISAVRFATELNRDSTRTTQYLEDPVTDGESEYVPETHIGLVRGAIALHYGRVLSRLGLQLLSSALDHGFFVPDELRFQIVVWECLVPPLQGKRFIGGYVLRDRNRTPRVMPNPSTQALLELGETHAPFVGLELSAAEELGAAARGDWNRLSALPVLDVDEPGPSQLTWLKDGTVMGPVEFFRPVDVALL